MATDTEVLEHDELEALFDQVNTRTPSGARNLALLKLMAQTGVRCGEALKIRATDIRQEVWGANGDQIKVWVLRLPKGATKGQQSRDGIPLSSTTRQAVECWQEKRSALGIRGGPLFCTISHGKRVHGKPSVAGFQDGKDETALKAGGPLNSRYVRELVTRLAKKAGITRRVHPHMLRHTALTMLYDRTQDLRLVQQVAGHSTSRLTERYTRVHPLALAKAMGAMED